jgi:hypothetical protein
MHARTASDGFSWVGAVLTAAALAALAVGVAAAEQGRVPQQRLTNVIRHAPGASAQVHARYARDQLVQRELACPTLDN